MAQTGSTSRLLDQAGVPLDLQSGTATPAGQSGLIAMGSDGSNIRFLLVDASGRPIMVGAGVAGTPAGGVASVQGVAGGTALPVSSTTLALDRTTAAAPASVELSDGAAFYVGAKTGQLPAALVGGRLDDNIGSWLGSTAPTVGQKAMANSIPVVIASDQGAIPVTAGKSGTGTRTLVATSATAVTILASNANRNGAIIFNDSTKVVYLLLSGTGTVAANLFSTRLQGGDYYEVPAGYTGIITGLWSATGGNGAQVTEFTT